MEQIAQIAKQMNQELASRSSMAVGKVLKHPDGRTVRIKRGCYLDPVYNRVSNWWTWQRLFKNGKLGKEESGYGW